MTRPDPGPHPKDPAGEATGLPWPTTWPGVYRLVVACFVLQVVALVLVREVFSP